MSLSSMLMQARPLVERALREVSPPYTLFFSISDAKHRAEVRHSHAKDFPSAWQELAQNTRRAAQQSKMEPCWLRIDWVTRRSTMTLAGLHELLQDTKRSYFRYGLALDVNCKIAFLEQELNGNAMLYGGNKIDHAFLNEKNFLSYYKKRFPQQGDLNLSEERSVVLLSTEGLFCEKDQEPVYLYEAGLNAGRRIIDKLGDEQVTKLIRSGSHYLANQVKPNGLFHYGWHACFDREINTYNNLRHASSTYAMIEAWEVTKEPSLIATIQRSLKLLTDKLIKPIALSDGQVGAFLVEPNNEIKLGGNAVSLLSLVKYSEVVQTQEYAELMEQLAVGIAFMQNPENGQFCHVLEYPSLKIKDQHRVIYYDGEAAFGLMRLYDWSKDERWLAVVEKAFDYFIVSGHWRAHDHWLSYCVNELTIYRPKEKYYQFGIRNFTNYLDFVENRITTFPTLLELMMAAEKMIVRLGQQSEFQYLLDQVDLEHFYRALHKRAAYLLNGHFWPEFAMFFKNPEKILGSFFIRHHAFRIRIDDVEHYLSGFVAYRKFLIAQNASEQPINQPAETVDNVNEEKTTQLEIENLPVLAWGGDVNLGRRQHYRTAQLGVDEVLGKIPALKNADISAVNLECVVSTQGEQGISKGESSSYYYRARPEMLSVLIAAGVDIVTTANNHSGDYGPEALLEQEHWLDITGIGHTGSGENLDEALQPVFRPAGPLNVALFSIDATQPRFAAGPTSAGCAYLPLSLPELWRETLGPRISAARTQAQVVIVAVHWGANRETYPSKEQIDVGHAIIDAGADAILGTSAHNLQGIEVYRNRPIIHDAGDLLFDAVRNSLADSGIFRLQLSTHGVEQITFVPVGVGFGFSTQLSREEAVNLSRQFSNQCLPLGTKLSLCEEGTAILRLTPPRRDHVNLPSFPKTLYQITALQQQPSLNPRWQVKAVPVDAQTTSIKIGPLELLGVRFYPREVKSRQILWVESFWRTDNEIQEDFRLDCRAVPVVKTTMPYWGKSMDHDPCDWQLPTSRWKPGTIYRDLYGLRPPASRDITDVDLQLHIGLVSNSTKIKPVPIAGMITKINFSRNGENRKRKIPQYRSEFPSIIYDHPPGQTWNAKQITAIAGGTWLVPPPEGWFVRSVISGSAFIEDSLDPILFVAHTNLDRMYHEQSSKTSAKFWDFHQKLPSFAHRIAGAIVARPVEGLPKELPILKVDDPIKAIIELGLAARDRFDGEVIALTGTAGKSTTLKMIGQMLGPRDQVLTSLGNYNSRVGAPSMLASLSKDHEAAVIEVAQSALWMKRGPITHRIKPTISLITEIGISQTDRKVKNVEDTARWKSRIYDGLVGSAIAIVGEHLQCFDYVLNKAKKHARRVIIFGESTNAEIRIINTRADELGSWVRLQLPSRELELRVPIPSIGMLHNALAAISVAYALGRDLDEAAMRLQELHLDESHLQRLSLNIRGQSITLIDDSWNATVSSMLNAFSVFSQSMVKQGGRKVAVLGRIVHLGEKSKEIHASLAKPLLQSKVDWVITHGEDMLYLRECLPPDILGPHFSDAPALVDHITGFCQNFDLILVKGSRRDSDFGKIPALLQKTSLKISDEASMAK
ncbi:UDP-N-acetylmuramoyl-tripeptide--D-alanyl-D-alanine ligase [Microbulbifer sp. NBRC 101763]|uniref:CapA family protein n=1 Tax=Microbulbifer sp. NBRC 101763 TaxID=1113820 RepID=UPI0030AC3F0E